MNRERVKIITYHYVRNVNETDYPGINALSVHDFTRQIEWISRNGNVINILQLLAAWKGDEKLPANSYLLTFDDGYIDHFVNVLPILKAYGMTGVFFVPGRAVCKREMLDVNKIHFMLGSGVSVKRVTQRLFHEIDPYRGQFPLSSNRDYWQKYAKPGRFDNAEVVFVKKMLQHGLPDDIRSKIVDRLFREYVGVDPKEFADGLYLTFDHLKAMKSSGMEIGSHGYSHGWLGKLSKEEQVLEIEHAVQRFSNLGIHKENWMMCYPYGSYNDDTIEVLKKFGCQLAFTTKGGITNIAETSRYEINRMDTNELALVIS